MTKKISKHSKSFAWLFAIILLGTFFALFSVLQFKMGAKPTADKNYEVITYSPSSAQTETQPQIIVDTSNWLQYKDETYGIKFKYDPDWKIRSLKNKEGYYVIEIDPGIKYDNFRVFISKDDYFALSGVPTSKTLIDGKEAVNLDGAVLGIQDNATYFTFDMGASLSLKPYFQALVSTVEFN